MMQIFCSPLQRMGAAAPISCQNETRPAKPTTVMRILRRADMKGQESVRCFIHVLGMRWLMGNSARLLTARDDCIDCGIMLAFVGGAWTGSLP